MLYGRMGNPITLEREATEAEVLAEWRGKNKKNTAEERKLAKERCGYAMLWWGKDEDGERQLYELAYCRADNGFAEIDDTRKALMTPERYSEATGIPA